jgi:site-specific recombinase XerD
VNVNITADDQLVLGWSRDMRRRGLLDGTVTQRESRLRLFAAWLDRPLMTTRRDDIESFLDERKGRDGPHLGARARYRWVSDFHIFFAWTIREEIDGAHDPTTRILRPKLRPLLPRPRDNRDVERALRRAGPRMRAMLLCAQLAGARCGDIARLERGDVLDADVPPVVIFHGKGEKDRVVPLHPELVDALRQVMPRSGRVFVNADGRPMSARHVSHEGNGYLHRIGVGATMHTLRHWFGTEFLRATGNLRATQEVLGHANMASTAGYTKWLVGDSVGGVLALQLPRSVARSSPPVRPETL